MNMDKSENIRTFNGVEYRVIKTPCTCICHSHVKVLHVKACCNNGFVEHLEKKQK